MVEQLPLVPLARMSDPPTSAQAVEAAALGSSALNDTIALVAVHATRPLTAFEFAARVERFMPGRWDEGSVRTAVSRLGKCGKLVKGDENGRSPRGHACDTWRLP